MILTLRKRYSGGLPVRLQLHALASRRTLGSNVERGSAFGNFGAGGYTGFLLNSLDPERNYGTSDFDVTPPDQLQLASGTCRSARGASSAANAGGFAEPDDRRLVDRRADPLDERLPVQRPELPLLLAHELEPAGQRQPGRSRTGCRRPRLTQNAVDNRPSPFADPEDALTFFRFSLPGEAGDPQHVPRRRLLHDRHQPQQGVDARHLGSPPALPLGRVQRDRTRRSSTSAALTMLPDRSGFGRYNGTLATCDAQAGRCMQFALRYEF